MSKDKRRPGKNRSQASGIQLATWHYTNDAEFDLQPIQIDPTHHFINKPIGSLWVSPCDAIYNWHRWCDHNQYPLGYYRYCITLDTTNIITISDLADCEALPQVTIDETYHLKWFIADYPALQKMGIDAVWLTNDGLDLYSQQTYVSVFYGWDCESIAILNARCVTQVEIDPQWRGATPPAPDWKRPVYSFGNESCADPHAAPE